MRNFFRRAALLSILIPILAMPTSAKEQQVKPWKVILEHLVIAFVVIVITHYVGDWVSGVFG